MRATPPAVSLRCSGGLLWHRLQWLLPALAAAVFAVWLWAVLNPYARSSGWAIAAQAMLPGLAVAALLRWALPRQDVVLVWDGHAWFVSGQACAPQVMLDLGPWLLLRCKAASPLGQPSHLIGRLLQSRQLWVAVSQADAALQTNPPGTWHALRAALFARHKRPRPVQTGRPH